MSIQQQHCKQAAVFDSSLIKPSFTILILRDYIKNLNFFLLASMPSVYIQSLTLYFAHLELKFPGLREAQKLQTKVIRLQPFSESKPRRPLKLNGSSRTNFAPHELKIQYSAFQG